MSWVVKPYSKCIAIGALIAALATTSGCRSNKESTVSAHETLAPAEQARVDEGSALDEELPGFGSTPANFEDPNEEIESIGNDPRSRENARGIDKIVGGTEVPPGDFPEIVGIAAAGSTVLRCTGTLIAPDIVLSAAHCACASIDKRVFVGNRVTTGGAFYDVKASQHGLKKEADGRTCVYPKDLKGERDLAVLLLAKPVANVIPRAVAPDALVNSARSYRVVGFGATDRNATNQPRQKMEAEVFATSNNCTVDDAGRRDEQRYGCKPNEEIVAGGMRHPTDTCNGDSGGPLLVSLAGTGKGAGAEYRLAGVTSRASSLRQSKCGDGGVYERLNGPARQWITTTVATLRARR